MNKTYLISTDGYKALDCINELLQEPTTMLIDVRLKSYSWRVDFRYGELRSAYGKQYRAGGKQLGNIAKHGSGLIRIANPIAGIQRLVRYLNAGHDLVLLYYDEQHIQEICRLLVGVRPEVEVIPFASVIRNSPAS